MASEESKKGRMLVWNFVRIAQRANSNTWKSIAVSERRVSIKLSKLLLTGSRFEALYVFRSF